MHANKWLTAILAIGLVAMGAMAARHLNIHHGFAPLTGTVLDDAIIIDNPSSQLVFSLDTAQWTLGGEMEVRLANLNNKERKKYSYTTADGNIQHTSTPQWGVVWNWQDDENYDALILQASKGDYWNDFAEKRHIIATLESHSNGNTTIIGTIKIHSNDANVECGYNSINITIENNRLAVKLGKKELHTLWHNITWEGSGKVGIVAGSGAKVAVKSVYINPTKDPDDGYRTTWTEESLRTHFAHSSDIMEGFWKHLDRKSDGTRVKLGGTYRLAVVNNSKGGYDIIYIAGAKVNGKIWHTGLIKGSLSPTNFRNNWRLKWRDAEKNILDDDNNANLLNNGALELNFPVLKSTIRFEREF